MAVIAITFKCFVFLENKNTGEDVSSHPEF